tara:strand:- start:7418 stop:7726 length:309 start_codon:yes stop_codon:yes gene_type:complete
MKTKIYTKQNVNETIENNKLIDFSGNMNIDDLNKLNELRIEILFSGEVYKDKSWENLDDWNRLNKIYNQFNKIKFNKKIFQKNLITLIKKQQSKINQIIKTK